MTRLGLEYVTYRDHGVLLWIILQDVIMIINTVTTCNYFYYVTGMVWCMINKILKNTITKDQHAIINVGCSQFKHWLGQFCSRNGPDAQTAVKQLSIVQIVRVQSSSHQ